MPAIRKAMPTGNQGTLQDSDSSDNDDSDFWSSSSGGMGVHEQKLYSDCEYLRQRNADLRDEIERVNGLYDRRQKEMEVTLKKNELVWGHLPVKPLGLQWYLSHRGFEFCQLYFWVVRDYGWAYGVEFRQLTAVMGGLAVAHACVLLVRNAWGQDPWESASAFTRLLWLAAMYRFLMATLAMPMNGKTGNYYIEPLLPALDGIRNDTASTLVLAFILEILRLGLRHLAHTQRYPFRGVPVLSSHYENPDLSSTVFRGLGAWRDVENLFIFFAVGRDLALCKEDQYMWSALSFGGLLLPLFLANSTLNNKRALIDHCHYLGLLVWFGASTLGQMGHLWFRETFMNWDFAARGRVRSELTCNLWTGILLTAATVPLVVLYLLWLTATCAGWIKGREPETQVERLVRHLSSPAEADHASDPLAERAVPIETAWLEANKPGSFAPV